MKFVRSPAVWEDFHACVIPACFLTLQIQSLSELEVLTIRIAPFKGAPPLMFPDPQGQLQAVRELTLHGLDDLLAEWFGDKWVHVISRCSHTLSQLHLMICMNSGRSFGDFSALLLLCVDNSY